MPHHICIICGTQFAETSSGPPNCPICLDERQYIGPNGQQWTTLDDMRTRGAWKNTIRQQEPNLTAIGTDPKFAIGQRALLIQSPHGNILWDCLTYLDDETIRTIRALGGISAIAISHPHYFSTMIEWSHAFENAPIHLHEADRQWVQRPDPAIRFWTGSTHQLADGLTLIHTPGHFDGFQVLHWRDGAEGRGVLLSGDQPQVCADPRWVSFMWSYPNYIPLNARQIDRITNTLAPFDYDRLYGAFWPSIVPTDAKSVVERSATRYLRHITTP